MELLLWRWSTAFQCASALMMAVFFVVLARSVRRAELQPWVVAWLSNLVALVVPIILWFFRPQSLLVSVAMRWSYLLSKTAWVMLLVVGAEAFVGGRPARPGVICSSRYSPIRLWPRLS